MKWPGDRFHRSYFGRKSLRCIPRAGCLPDAPSGYPAAVCRRRAEKIPPRIAAPDRYGNTSLLPPYPLDFVESLCF